MSTYTFKIQQREVQTRIISTDLELEPGLRELMLSSVNKGGHVVGLDIEQTNAEIDLLKLASGNICLLIQLSRIGRESIPSSLSRFLQLPDISFVGVGIKYSLDALERVYGVRARCRNFADLGFLAATIKREPEFQGSGLCSLARYFHLTSYGENTKSPDVAFGDWNAVVLSEDQIRSATTDAYLAFLIGGQLSK